MSEERKYEPTPKRRQEAQRKGQFAYSADLLAAAVFLFALTALYLSAGGIYTALKEQLLYSFTFHESDLQAPDIHALRLSCWRTLGWQLWLTLPFWIMTIASAVIFHFAQRRFLFAPEREIVSAESLNPIEGFKRIFSARNFWRTLLAAVKTFALVLILYLFCKDKLEKIVFFVQMPLAESANELYALVWGLLWEFAIAMIILGIVDYTWQYWTFERSIRMTEQQMRDEMKDS